MPNIYVYPYDNRANEKSRILLNGFAQSCGAIMLGDGDYALRDGLCVFRSKRGPFGTLVQQCWDENRPFLYFDSGYFMNHPRKVYQRIAVNHHEVIHTIDRSPERWVKLQKTAGRIEVKGETIQLMPWKLEPWRTNGEDIVVCVPTETSIVLEKTTPEQWVEETVATLKKHTDRRIILREKPDIKIRRSTNDSFWDFLERENIYATVSYYGAIGVESVMAGYQAFVMPNNAALPMARTDLWTIERPYTPARQRWFQNLCYYNWTNEEIADGTAWSYIRQDLKVLGHEF